MMRVLSKPPIFATIIAITFSFLPFAFEAKGETEPSQMWLKGQDPCVSGIHEQPQGRMAVLLICKDALGDYIGVINYERAGFPILTDFLKKLSNEEKKAFFNSWPEENSMWQDRIWAADVTSYAWSPDGKKLYVATSDIYGSGAFYELDLIHRRYKQIAPLDWQASRNNPGPGYYITRISKEEGKVFYKQGNPFEKNDETGRTAKEQFVEISK